MNSLHSPQARKYALLGQLLRKARKELPGKVEVADIAKQLGVSSSFVYQVEQGSKKPRKKASIEQWAETYRIPLTSNELWEALIQTTPLYVEILRKREVEPKEEKAASPDPLVELLGQLGADEKAQVTRFIEFLQWARQQSRV